MTIFILQSTPFWWWSICHCHLILSPWCGSDWAEGTGSATDGHGEKEGHELQTIHVYPAAVWGMGPGHTWGPHPHLYSLAHLTFKAGLNETDVASANLDKPFYHRDVVGLLKEL